MSDFRNCIVGFVDLIGVTSKINAPNRLGIPIMRAMHKTVDSIAPDLLSIDNIYVWNDSILIHSLAETPDSYKRIMSDIHRLKVSLNDISRSFAICMKGQSFPLRNNSSLTANESSKVTYLEASSLAFANCFAVEKSLSTHRKDWYIDSRITTHIDTRPPDLKKRVVLLPRKTSRTIHLYDGSFEQQ